MRTSSTSLIASWLFLLAEVIMLVSLPLILFNASPQLLLWFTLLSALKPSCRSSFDICSFYRQKDTQRVNVLWLGSQLGNSHTMKTVLAKSPTHLPPTFAFCFVCFLYCYTYNRIHLAFSLYNTVTKSEGQGNIWSTRLPDVQRRQL